MKQPAVGQRYRWKWKPEYDYTDSVIEVIEKINSILFNVKIIYLIENKDKFCFVGKEYPFTKGRILNTNNCENFQYLPGQDKIRE